ncbi:Tetraspanin [Aphelenchoides bicaudatus]|nr:Tetraspanin [Aphelenchoides bicaudatus]
MGSLNRWTAYGSIGKSIRMLYFSTTLLTIMFSLAVFIFGAWLYYNLAAYSELLTPSLYLDVSRIMMIVSLLAVINSVISIYGIIKELRCMIYSFSIASVIIFIMLFVGGIIGFVFRHKLEYIIPLDLKMSTSLRELYGQDEIPSVTSAWDTLQSNFECCGVNGTDNWNIWTKSKWHMHHTTEPDGSRPKVPASCCHSGHEKECQDPFIDASNSTGIIFKDTCYDLLRNKLLSNIYVAAWLSIVESISLLIPAFFAAVYARLIRK